ncbi:efflux RND transporter periplasmic adaptor subunit [Marinicella sp. W31]|uniref:efflux RND transporter periplasmic adaptor subunit n=1 Tax=Marinicella sp. W31 TaxID=3023713 RepID=UPI003756E473
MFFRTSKLLFLSCLVLTLTACGNADKEPAQAPPPAEVVFAKPLKKNITQWDEYTGRFEAVNNVSIRSRVTGYLNEVRFEDGDYVEEGQVLFVIDPRSFEYAVSRARAQYSLADKEFKRADRLGKSSAISQEDIDRRFQELQVADAALKQARLDLEFTEVKSPISGKVSRDFVNVGNLVRANETVLTRVVSVEPMHFYFDASQSELLKYIRLDRAGKRPSSDYSPNPIFIRLQDEEKYIHQGYMDFVDNVVDADTGTIQGRALVPNPDSIINSGMFGRARLLGANDVETILVPDTAINTEQSRKFVYVVTDDNTVTRSYVTLGRVRDSGLYVIESGLSGDERVVISGIQRIRAPDQPVTPMAGEITETEEVSLIPPRSEWLDFGQKVREKAKPQETQSTSQDDANTSNPS